MTVMWSPTTKCSFLADPRSMVTWSGPTGPRPATRCCADSRRSGNHDVTMVGACLVNVLPCWLRAVTVP